MLLQINGTVVANAISNKTSMSTIIQEETKRLEHRATRAERAANKERVLLSHSGVLTLDRMNDVLGCAEKILLKSGANRKVVKRMYTILIEGLQNIKHHGKNDRLGSLSASVKIMQDEDCYRIQLGNLIQHVEAKHLGEQVEGINSMDRSQVKALYMEELQSGALSTKGGAGLGMMVMALKSQNKIELDSKVYSDELTFLTIHTQINN
ncbi:MAG: vancomycin resistance protein YoaR [Crocinitomicaceae bacterium]